jgi:four helix bundle protein
MAVSIRHFRELDVYKLAMDAAMTIFVITKSLPVEERYSLTDQMRRSSRSVCANIAEGWRKRRYPAAFISKLNDAEAEAAETEVWLEFSLKCGWIDRAAFNDLEQSYEHILGKLVRMISHPDQWTILGIREEPNEYDIHSSNDLDPE